MKERPILFSAPMVRAILAGTKTQTRRTDRYMMEYPPASSPDVGLLSKSRHGESLLTATWDATNGKFTASFCPYGKVGDRLWVRETWKTVLHFPGYDNGLQESGGEDSEPGVATVAYAAGGEMLTVDFLEEIEDEQAARACKGKWKPSIHMPRWASRIILEIVSVRIERLNDINRGDAMAEGCPFPNMERGDDPCKWYADLWNSINGPDSWNANPYVWVIEFQVVK